MPPSKKSPRGAAASQQQRAPRTHRLTCFDVLVLLYLVSHIPITLFIDAQAIIPARFYPPQVPQLLAWYAALFGDGLMSASGRPPWFQGIVSIEVTLQMLYFFWAIRAWWRGDNRIRIPTIIYGAHTATTLIPIMSTFLAAPVLPRGMPSSALLQPAMPVLLQEALVLPGNVLVTPPPAAVAWSGSGVGSGSDGELQAIGLSLLSSETVAALTNTTPAAETEVVLVDGTEVEATSVAMEAADVLAGVGVTSYSLADEGLEGQGLQEAVVGSDSTAAASATAESGAVPEPSAMPEAEAAEVTATPTPDAEASATPEATATPDATASATAAASASASASPTKAASIWARLLGSNTASSDADGKAAAAAAADAELAADLAAVQLAEGEGGGAYGWNAATPTAVTVPVPVPVPVPAASAEAAAVPSAAPEATAEPAPTPEPEPTAAASPVAEAEAEADAWVELEVVVAEIEVAVKAQLAEASVAAAEGQAEMQAQAAALDVATADDVSAAADGCRGLPAAPTAPPMPVPVVLEEEEEPAAVAVEAQASIEPQPTPEAPDSATAPSSPTSTAPPHSADPYNGAGFAFQEEWQRWALLAIYAPYLLMPLAMLAKAWAHDPMFPGGIGAEDEREAVGEEEGVVEEDGAAGAGRARFAASAAPAAPMAASHVGYGRGNSPPWAASRTPVTPMAATTSASGGEGEAGMPIPALSLSFSAAGRLRREMGVIPAISAPAFASALAADPAGRTEAVPPAAAAEAPPSAVAARASSGAEPALAVAPRFSGASGGAGAGGHGLTAAPSGGTAYYTPLATPAPSLGSVVEPAPAPSTASGTDGTATAAAEASPAPAAALAPAVPALPASVESHHTAPSSATGGGTDTLLGSGSAPGMGGFPITGTAADSSGGIDGAGLGPTSSAASVAGTVSGGRDRGSGHVTRGLSATSSRGSVGSVSSSSPTRKLSGAERAQYAQHVAAVVSGSVVIPPKPSLGGTLSPSHPTTFGSNSSVGHGHGHGTGLVTVLGLSPTAARPTVASTGSGYVYSGSGSTSLSGSKGKGNGGSSRNSSVSPTKPRASSVPAAGAAMPAARSASRSVPDPVLSLALVQGLAAEIAAVARFHGNKDAASGHLSLQTLLPSASQSQAGRRSASQRHGYSSGAAGMVQPLSARDIVPAPAPGSVAGGATASLDDDRTEEERASVSGTSADDGGSAAASGSAGSRAGSASSSSRRMQQGQGLSASAYMYGAGAAVSGAGSSQQQLSVSQLATSAAAQLLQLQAQLQAQAASQPQYGGPSASALNLSLTGLNATALSSSSGFYSRAVALGASGLASSQVGVGGGGLGASRVKGGPVSPPRSANYQRYRSSTESSNARRGR